MLRHSLCLLVFALFSSCLLIAEPAAAATAVKTPAPPPAPQQGGVGLQVVPIATGEIVVIAVLPGSPAAKAKLLPGDLIIAVDGKSLRGTNFADVTRSRLWGKVGSKVKITWQRPGVKGNKNAQLLRATIKEDAAQDLEVRMLLPASNANPEAAKP